MPYFAVSMAAGGECALRMLVSPLVILFLTCVAGAEDAPAGGVCIGTPQECAARTGAPVRPGFDVVIAFEFDSAELTEEAKATLAQFARALRENRLRTSSFVIEGHADAKGTAAYNAGLSRRRAEAVERFLIENGVEAVRVSTAGMGAASPRVDDPFDPANRRVEVRITP